MAGDGNGNFISSKDMFGKTDGNTITLSQSLGKILEVFKK